MISHFHKTQNDKCVTFVTPQFSRFQQLFA